MKARAAQSLAIIGVLLVVVDLAAAPSAMFSLAQVQEGSTAGEWLRYQSAPAPDVLFIGDSRTRLDIDTSLLSEALTERAGHSIRVGRIGISSGRPETTLAVVQRVMEMAQRPRNVVIGLSEWQFNENYTVDLTPDLWQMSLPMDPEYVKLSFGVTRPSYWPRLLRSYALPGMVDARVLGEETRCQLLRTVPKGVLAKMTDWTGQACLFVSDNRDSVMDDGTEQFIRTAYRTAHLHDYEVSAAEVADVRNAVARLRAGGVRVTFINFPMYFIETINPDAYTAFAATAANLSAGLGVPYLDLHLEMRAIRTDWRDPSHLNVTGVAKWTPHLADVLVQNGVEP